MTFQQYIDNPMGQKNAVFSQRYMYRDLYTEKFDKILLREAGKIDFKLYKDAKKDEYYVHIKIPSEVVPKFYYDVVVQFYTADNAKRTENDLTNYFVRFYSNDPAFVFTFLHVFNKNDMFVKALESKSPKLAIKEKPKEKNPLGVIGYVKSLYFAYLVMKLKKLFIKANFDMYGTPFDQKMLVGLVEHADKKIADRQEAGVRIEKEKKVQERESQYQKDKARLSRVNSNTSNVKITSTVSTTRSITPITRVKTVKTGVKKK